jgi:hypothetical protein
MPHHCCFSLPTSTVIQARADKAQSEVFVRDGVFGFLVRVSISAAMVARTTWYEKDRKIDFESVGMGIHSVIGAIPNAAYLAGNRLKQGTGTCVSLSPPAPNPFLEAAYHLGTDTSWSSILFALCRTPSGLSSLRSCSLSICGP